MLEVVMSGNNKLDVIKPHVAVGFLLSGLHHTDCVRCTLVLSLRVMCTCTVVEE
jgi:hypothetical protein